MNGVSMIKAQELWVSSTAGFAGVNCSQRQEIGNFNTSVQELVCWRTEELRAEGMRGSKGSPGEGELIPFRETEACVRGVCSSAAENQLTRAVCSLLSWQPSQTF